MSSNEGTSKLVIRVKRITSPVKALLPGYDGWLPKPEEGQLIMRRQRDGRLEPWSFDIDKQGKTTGLEGLFRDI